MFGIPISFRNVNWMPADIRQARVPAKNTAAQKNVTAQTARGEEDVRRLNVTLYEGAFNPEMGDLSSHYIPPRLNEDGSWSLAEYVPPTPDGPLPDGAVPLPSPGDRELLDRLDRLADRLRCGFDARA